MKVWFESFLMILFLAMFFGIEKRLFSFSFYVEESNSSKVYR